jgi:hypothetical protein
MEYAASEKDAINIIHAITVPAIVASAIESKSGEVCRLAEGGGSDPMR